MVFEGIINVVRDYVEYCDELFIEDPYSSTARVNRLHNEKTVSAVGIVLSASFTIPFQLCMYVRDEESDDVIGRLVKTGYTRPSSWRAQIRRECNSSFKKLLHHII